MNVKDSPSTIRDTHRRSSDERFTLCGLRMDPDGRWIHETLKVTALPEDVTCQECKRRQEDEEFAEWLIDRAANERGKA